MRARGSMASLFRHFGGASLAMVMTIACESPPPKAPVGNGTGAKNALARLTQGIRGSWTRVDEGRPPLAVAYRSLSSDTALAESFGVGSNHETLTVVYPDHDTLMLTHYCAQGNQARLTATEVTEHKVAFRLVEVTNFQKDQAVLDRLVFEWHGDTMDKTEIYKQPNGSFETTVLHFARALARSEPAPAPTPTTPAPSATGAPPAAPSAPSSAPSSATAAPRPAPSAPGAAPRKPRSKQDLQTPF